MPRIQTNFYHCHKQNVFRFLLMMVLLCCITKNTQAQSAGDKIIPNDQLKWEYYTQISGSDSGYWANTLWNVYYKYHIVSFHFDTVKVVLDAWHVLKANSWVRKDKESDELLHHEQGHFNTAILCEAEFKKAVDTTTLLLGNYSQKIDSVFNVVLKRIGDLNIEYDKETNHMWNKEAQKQWDMKIDEMISQATQ